MPKSKLFVRAACTVLLTLLFSSCKKVIDYIEQHPEAYIPPCRITNYRVSGGPGAKTNFVVSYDAKGNPITMMDSDRVNAVGTDQYFRYDKFNRLSDYMQAYAPATGAIEWDKYAYPRPNYVIDTAMFYETGDVRGPSPIAKNTLEYRISAYTLDQLGRIVKIWDIPNDSPNTPSLQNTVVYDANGNLPVRYPVLFYDNKVNPYRTSKTWQFVYQNYSRNNLEYSIDHFSPQYNVFGLPLTLDNLAFWGFYPFDQVNLGTEATIDYACDLPQGPVVY
jgi:hypothetical protein